uniref:Helicase ATP-binding domain-containing protein n=1 Tax=viral metagenome TaxID=1070528 RepID=A0A6C0JUV6_9ZZZZ
MSSKVKKGKTRIVPTPAKKKTVSKQQKATVATNVGGKKKPDPTKKKVVPKKKSVIQKDTPSPKESPPLVKKRVLRVKYSEQLDEMWKWYGLNAVPEEILLDIFKFVGMLNCYVLKTVNKQWHRIITGEFAMPKWINRYIPPIYSPFQYQFDVIKWMRLQKYGGILSMEPGMGKTMTSLTYINISYSIRNLVLCNKSQMSIWKDETGKFYGEHFKVLCCHTEYDGHIKDFSEEQLAEYDIIVVTYQNARHIVDPANPVSRIFWNNVFCDEVHTLRNQPTSMYPFVDAIKKTKMWGLTGSLIYNSMNDARNIQKLIDDTSVYSYNNIKVLRFADVDIKLPTLTIHSVSTPRTAVQDRLYTLYDTKALDTIEQLGAHGKNLSAIWTIIHRMRQLSISPALIRKSHTKLGDLAEENRHKAPRIEHICDSIQSDTRQSLVFSYYTETLDLIRQNLLERNIPCFIVKSADKLLLRDDSIVKFIKGKYRVLLMTYAIGSHGYNLVNASKVYLAEVWWNMQVMQQAFKRAYRLGQENHVDVYMYATDNSIESRMLDISKGKQTIEDALINECKPKSKLSLQEIKSLF